MAVEMDRVGYGERGLDHQISPNIRVRQLQYCVGCLVCCVAGEDLLEGRVLPFDDHGGAVQVPTEQAVRVESYARSFDVGTRFGFDGLADVRNQIIGLVVATIIIGIGGSGRCRGRVAVVDDTANVVRVVVIRASRLRNGAQPKIVSNISLIGGDDNVVSLAHADIEYCRLVGCDRHKVRSNDLHGVIVDHELEMGIDSRIHEANTI